MPLIKVCLLSVASFDLAFYQLVLYSLSLNIVFCPLVLQAI